MKNKGQMSGGERLKSMAVFAWQEGTVYIILIALIILFGCFNPSFLSGRNIYNLITQSTYYIIAGMGISFVMIGGGLDFSVGYQMAMVSTISAILMLEHGSPIWILFIIGPILGFLMGSVNGVITAKLKLFPLIVTLATSEVFKGIAYTITQSKTYSGMPDAFRAMYKVKIAGLPVDVYVALGVVIVTWIVLNKTYFGRNVLAIGGNRECSRLSGINSVRVQILCYAICGAIFGLTALDMMAQQNMTSASTGPGTEFICLTAAIIGGISFTGGKGNVWGMVAGIFVMQIISNGMQLAGWGTYAQYAVKGLILIAAITFDSMKSRPKPVVRVHKEDAAPASK